MKPWVWRLVVGVASFGAAWAARKGATLIWSKVSDTDAPVNPADRSVSWPEAMGWAALAGTLAGVARVVGRRGAAAAWQGAVGEAPPGIEAA